MLPHSKGCVGAVPAVSRSSTTWCTTSAWSSAISKRLMKRSAVTGAVNV
ncbi:MAG: hypothetical protein U0325_34645 [Polyangiales bacterium]